MSKTKKQPRTERRAKAAAKQQAFLEREERRKAKLHEELRITYGGLARVAR